MARDVAPWRSGRGLSTPRTDRSFQDPFFALHQQIERAFDDIFSGFGVPAAATQSGRGAAACDIRETNNEVEVCVDLPGFQEKDIDVSLQDNALTIKADTAEESEDKRKDYIYSERRRGSVYRTISLPETIDQDRVTASFENGVLTVKVPKSEAKATARRIPVSGAGRAQTRQSPPLQQAAQQPQGASRQQQGGGT